MMDTAFEGHKLQASFTFRIVEAVKRIKINPMPRTAGLPWGLSLAAGIAIVVMTLGSQVAIHQLWEPLMFPSKAETPKVREMSVDILAAPGTSVMAGKQGHTDGAGSDRRSPENNSFLAPAKGGGTWTQKADMPTARFNPGSAVVNGKIYVIGGRGGQKTLSAVEEYDPAADTWTRRADMPAPRQAIGVAAVDGIIYVIGGWNAEGTAEVSTVEAYDPAADSWTTKADMPTRRAVFATAVVDGTIYAIGGVFGEKTVQDNRALSAVDAYDPATDMWTTKADMPTARDHLAACAIDGRIYVSGGGTKWGSFPGGGLGAIASVPTVEVYDPATDTWTQVSDMPWPRYGHSASLVAGEMYIIGGMDPEVSILFEGGKITLGELAELFETVDVYDPKTDTWTRAARCPFATVSHAAGVVDGRIYEIGGRADTIYSKVYEFDPGVSGNIAITSPAGKLQTTWGQVKSQ